MKKHTCKLFKLALLLVSVWLKPASLPAQTYFQKVYFDSPYEQEGQDVLPTADGGYLIAGYSTTGTAGDADVEVIKTDAVGNLVWKKKYGGSKVDFIYHMTATADGNYLMAGYSQSYGGGDFDVLLIKIDPNGNTLWLKTYGSWGNDLGVGISSTNDGNFIVIGYSNIPSHADADMYLLKVDNDGNKLWEKWLGGAANEIGNCVKPCSDGGYILLGMSFSYGAGGGDAWLVKTDGDGNQSWDKTWGGANYDEGVYIDVNGDGSYTFVVRDSSSAGRDIDVRVVKTDAGGNEIWNKVYGGSRKDTPKMIQPTMDGGYVVAAITRSFGLVNPDMWIMRLDANGDTTWTRRYGGNQHEHCYVVRELSNGDLIAIGKTESYSPDMDVMFLKLNQYGILSPAGVESFATGRFSMYPNPSNGELNLHIPTDVTASIRITDVQGREVYAGESSQKSKVEIAMKGRDAGVYFVTVRSGDRTTTQKLILN